MILLEQSLSSQLLQLAGEGLFVTVGVTLCFSLGLVGAIQAGEARREQRGGALALWSLLAFAGFAAFAAFIVLGIAVVTNKS